MLDPIPWLRSPVAISAVATMISSLLALLGHQDLVPLEALKGGVEGFFAFVALVASGWTLYARSRSKIQPLTLTKAAADAAATGNPAPVAPLPPDSSSSAPRCHALICVVSLVSALLAMTVFLSLSGCGTLATSRAETFEQKAAASLGDFTLYQHASVTIGTDETLPLEVRRRVLDAEIAAKPLADEVDQYLMTYRSLKAGQPTPEQLAKAAADLQASVQGLHPLVNNLRTAVTGARP